MTTGLLGFSASLCTTTLYALFHPSSLSSSMMESFGRTFAVIVSIVTFFKMLIEAGIFYFLKADDGHFFKKTAVLMARPLKTPTAWRFVCGGVGIIMALMIFSIDLEKTQAPFNTAVYSFLSLLALIIGELLERYLFFRAVVPLKMPGGKIH